MLQEISESSSNRIVQRTSWSKERMLGLRNRSIFILLFGSVSAPHVKQRNPRPEHTDAHTRRRTRADARIHTCMRLFFPSSSSFFLSVRVLSPRVTPLGMNGRMERWMDGREGGWIRDMDGCDRAGGRRARIRLQPAH